VSLPAGVKLLKKGRVKYYTQRVTAPPMADCMFAALCTPLSFMGYRIPPSFVGELRKASGVPLFNIKGEPQGTNTAATKKALKKLLPDADVRFGGLPDREMLERIADGDIVVRVMASNLKLPKRLRRFVGRQWDGLHAVAIGGARRRADDEWEVLWMDPAARPGSGYEGEFVAYAEVKPALKRTSSGKVRVTYAERDSALPRPPRPPITPPNGSSSSEVPDVKLLTHGKIDEYAAIKRGTPFFHPQSGEQVTKASEDGEFRLAGRSEDGKFAGVWVNTRKIPGASGLTLLLVNASQIGEPFVRSS
jgi:hypothetical protein